MIDRMKVYSGLEAKAAQFAEYKRHFHYSTAQYETYLANFCQDGYQAAITKLSSYSAPGAMPSPEFLEHKDLVVSFPHRWNSHEAARRWAYSTLYQKTTFATDGSQILPSDHLSIPIAAVQVAWFENPHTTEGSFVKQVKLEILSPQDLTAGEQVSDQIVNLRRFQLEVEQLCAFMRRYQSASTPVAFLDGSLVISFAERWHSDQRKLFIESVTEVLDTAQSSSIPVVGYVDSTYACDLAVMLRTIYAADAEHNLHDAYLFRHLQWGDRTIFFTCCRGGLLDSFAKHRRGVGFVYLKTGHSLPVRLDIPVWVYEHGLLDYVIDIVRAEVIAGTGYPYPLSAATSAAAMTGRDRKEFYRLCQEFIQRRDLEVWHTRPKP